MSVQNQQFKNYEVWVIDGNSVDNTKEFLNKLEAPFYSISETDRGVYDAMNKGILKSKGKWLYFLGDDDIFFDEKVLQKIFSNEIDDQFKIIAGSIVYEAKESQFIYSKSKTKKKPDWSFLMWIRNGLHHQGAFYRKELFDKQKYNLQYPVLADYALNLTFFNKKYKCKLEKIVTTKCSGNGLSKTRNFSIYKEEILLKTDQSSKLFLPFFFIIAILKYFLGKKNANH